MQTDALAHSAEMKEDVVRNYITVNGLKLYYEIHGIGRPLLLLHGGLMTIPDFGPLLPALARTRQVIVFELEGHGRTADLDRPLRIEQIVEDAAGLLAQLGISQTDVCGFSLGGITAWGLAVRHAELVHRLVVVSAPINLQGFYPSIVNSWSTMPPDAFSGSPMEQAYRKMAPDPEHWPVFIQKVNQALLDFKGWPAAAIQSIQAPTLLLVGDTDMVRPEHTLEIFRLRGGGKEDGGVGALPASQLAILPAATHFTILTRVDLLLPIVVPFLDAPETE